jgi:serine protease Do
MMQAENLNRILGTVLLIILALGGFFVYQLNFKQKALEQALVNKQEPVACPEGQKIERVVETVVHKTSPWGSLQPQIKDAIVQVFSQVAEFNWFQPYQTPLQKMATGTGFFIDELGYMITNAHVVNQAKAVTIQIPSLGKEQFEVDIVSISFDRDLALLKLKQLDYERVTNLLGKINCLPIGDSDEVYRADQIMYQGFPLGQQGLKSTVGVVSGRENMGGRQYIQIDAAANPGCSGGPALNLNGEVVGVLNSGIVGAQNVGYLIPAKELKVVLHDLYHSTSRIVRRPFLGISYNSTGHEMNQFLKAPIDGGIYIIVVYKDSILDLAGVLAGDLVCEINGHKIDHYGEISVPWAEDKISLTEYTSYLSIGQQIELVLYRQGVRKTISFKFEQAKLSPIRFMYPDFEKIDYEVIGGFVFMEVTLNHVALMQQAVDDLVAFKNPKNQNKSRILVTHILPASLAQYARIFEPGNLIKSINEQSVYTLADLRSALNLSLQTGNLTVRTKQDVFAVFPMNKLLQQEAQLSLIYRYPLSQTVQDLIAKFSQQSAPAPVPVQEPATEMETQVVE